MPDLHKLHRHARAIFNHALTAVDPRPAVRDKIAQVKISTPSIYSIAIGKAAIPMALGLEDALGAERSRPGDDLDDWRGDGRDEAVQERWPVRKPNSAPCQGLDQTR